MRIMSEIAVVLSILTIVMLSATNGSIRTMILSLAILILSLSNLEDK